MNHYLFHRKIQNFPLKPIKGFKAENQEIKRSNKLKCVKEISGLSGMISVNFILIMQK